MQHIKDAIDKIAQFNKELKVVLAPSPDFATRSSAVLLSLENGFRGVVGLPLVSEAERPATGFDGKPHENFMGVVSKPAPVQEEDLAPQDDVLAKLKADIEEAWPTFGDRTNEDILKTVDPLVIRGIAKKAGVDGFAATKLDSAFIDDIKAHMIEQAQVNTAKASGLSGEHQEAIDRIVELDKELAARAEKEYTADHEAETREHFAGKTVDDCKAIIADLEKELATVTISAEQQEAIDKIVELKKAIPHEDGTEYSAADEAADRKELAAKTLDECLAILEQGKAVQADHAASNVTPATTPAATAEPSKETATKANGKTKTSKKK